LKVENKYNKLHFLALASLFVLGNAVITAPQNMANKYNFLGYLLSCGLGFGVCFVAYLIPFNKLTAAVFITLSLFCVGDSFVTFIKFIKQSLLPQIPPLFIVLPFLALVLFLSFKSENVVFKFSLFSIVPTVFIIILFFGSTAKDFRFSNIFIYSFPKISQLSNQFIFYIKSLVLPCFVLTSFAKLQKFKKGLLAAGLGSGFFLLALTILNSVLLFGIEFSGKLNYPYSSAGSTVTFGNLFTRLDGFLYFIFLCSCVIKCVVGIYVIKKSRSLFTP